MRDDFSFYCHWWIEGPTNTYLVITKGIKKHHLNRLTANSQAQRPGWRNALRRGVTPLDTPPFLGLLRRPPCGRLEVPAPAFGKPSRSPVLCASSPVVTWASVGGGGAGWEPPLCSHVDVCCLRGWLRRARRGTRRRRGGQTDLGQRSARLPKGQNNAWRKPPRCLEPLGQMAIKVPLGLRCAHRPVSFWETTVQDAGSALRAPSSCAHWISLLIKIRKGQVTPVKKRKRLKNVLLRLLIGSQQTWITTGAATWQHPDTTTSVSLLSVGKAAAVPASPRRAEHENTAVMRRRRVGDVMWLTTQPGGCTVQRGNISPPFFMLVYSWKAAREIRVVKARN